MDALGLGKGSSAVYLALAGGDPDWVTEHVEDIARINSTTVDALADAIRLRFPEHIPRKPVIARLGVPPAASPPTAPSPTAPPRAASPPAPIALPADEKPVGRPVSELEDRLRRMPYTYRIPPSALKQLFESYELHTQLADATQRENAQRTFLVSAIYAYMRSDLELKPGEDMPVLDLMQIALTMPIKAGSLVGTATPQRQEAIGILLNESDQAPYAPEDCDFYRRLALASFIRENAADPGILESRRAK